MITLLSALTARVRPAGEVASPRNGSTQFARSIALFALSSLGLLHVGTAALATECGSPVKVLPFTLPCCALEMAVLDLNENGQTSFISTGGDGYYVTPVVSGSSCIHAHDFDGDGKVDLPWHDTGGNVGIWFMNGR